MLLDVFTKFKPYADFIKEVDARGGIEGDIASYLVLPYKAQKANRDEWGEEAPKKIDQPLQELAKMKTEDWAFYAVFQKALFRATKIAFQHYDLTPGYTRKPFGSAWTDFLNTMAARNLLKVKAKHDEEPLWAGIGLSHTSHTITWSKSAVSRICSLLILWWYFHVNQLTRPNTFLSKLPTPQGSEKFPVGKSSLGSLMKGLESWAKYSDSAIADQPKKVTDRAANRLKSLMLLAKNDSATDEKDAIISEGAVGADAVEVAKSEPSDDIDLPDDTEVNGLEEET